MNRKPMLNAYPDSMGGTCSDIIDILKRDEFENTFGSFYILPSLFHTDLDRGFSVRDYDLEESLVKQSDLDMLRKMGIDLKLDFILNHASVLSPQFQDLLKNGERSKYRDFFIPWNTFWEGNGVMNEEGYIEPDAELIKDMFFRKPGLPILMVEMPEGKKVPYWNTFYQKVWREHGKTQYLGQMDLNVKSELVWEFYRETLEKLASYGAVIVRLDAFAYTSKEVGKRNFFNEPQTWEILERLTEMADQYGITLLPEIHAGYAEKRYLQVAEKGYVTYDFFLPGLIIDAIENKDGSYLKRWADEIIEKDIQVVNMLGCHDGIPILDLKGLLPEERIQKLTDVVISRGGRIKDLHGAENVYYQVNATYYSALGEDDDKMCLARAIQMFMPAKPQVWYLDIFAGKNDYEAVERAEEGGHKEINRTNLTMKEMEKRLKKDVVIRQLELIRLRNTNPAFDGSPTIAYRQQENILSIRWSNKHEELELTVDFNTCKYWICGQ